MNDGAPTNSGARSNGVPTNDGARGDGNAIAQSGARTLRLTVGIIVSITLAGFEGLGVTSAMPAAVSDLRGDAFYGWTFSAFQLAVMVATVVAGTAADRMGPARPFIAGLVLFAFGLTLGATASNIALFVASRAITGLGAGAIFNLNFVLIGRVYPEAQRSRMLAVATGAWVVPGLVGPTISGWITDHLSWRWVFGGLAPATPLIAALIIPSVRRLGGEGTAQLAPVGDRFWDGTPGERVRAAVLLALGAGLLLGGLSSSRPEVVAATVFGGILVGARPLARLVPTGTAVARPGLPAITVSYFLLMGAFVGTESFLPLMFQRARGMSSTEAGLVLTAGTVTWTLGSLLQARNPDLWARPRPMATAALLLAGGVVAAVTITFTAVPSAIAYVGWAIGAVGMGVAYNSLGALTYRHADAERVGVATGATGLAAALGGAMAAAVAGALVHVADRRYGEDSVIGLRWALGFQGGLGVLTSVAVFRADGRGRGSRRERVRTPERRADSGLIP